MKPIVYLILFTCLSGMLYISCSKEKLIVSEDARLSLSADTLYFDTVFTTTGSVTQGIRIFNHNDGRIRIDQIKLGGGQQSSFAMNVDGSPGTTIRDVEINAGDSLYVFVTVTIDPNSELLPFIVTDSIMINYNGNERKLQLQAYGQNAHFLKYNLIQGIQTWTKELPYVILGGLQVDTNAILTIEKGSRVYLHADAPFIVDGTLRVEGTLEDSVLFTGDRLDKEYRDLPAGWPGIYFRTTSHDNIIRYGVIKNGYQGIVADQPSSNQQPKLRITESKIDNMYESALAGVNSSIEAENCLITNSGINILVLKGGNYSFKHCTAASYSNFFILHKNPVLYLNNWDSVGGTVFTYSLRAEIINSIFWGEETTVENEVFVSKRGNNPFEVSFDNNIFKAVSDPDFSVLRNNLRNVDPLFDSVNISTRYYDFHIGKQPSPAIDLGINAGVIKDLEGKNRDAKPDTGCYEAN